MKLILNFAMLQFCRCKIYKNLIITRTFSKALSLAGLRNVSHNGREVANEFEKYGIAVRDVSYYQMLGNFIRINVGTQEENKKVIEVMHKIMEN